MFLVNVIRVRRAFTDSDIIVLPHHGSTYKASQQILGYFSAESEEKPKLFIVSSFPAEKDHLPKKKRF